MITKKYLEELLRETLENGLYYACGGLLDEEIDVGEFAYALGKFEGREEVICDLLALLDNANITPSC